MERTMVTTAHIKFKDGYKYQLDETYTIQTAIFPAGPIITEYIELDVNGGLTIKTGYAWDGPSGPTIDTKTFMRGSLVHDALYQLMRQGKLNKTWRPAADWILLNICDIDGMSKIRQRWVHKGVEWFAKKAAESSSKKKVIVAP